MELRNLYLVFVAIGIAECVSMSPAPPVPTQAGTPDPAIPQPPITEGQVAPVPVETSAAPAPAVVAQPPMPTVEIQNPAALAAAAGTALPSQFQGAEVAVILSRGQFYPSVIRLRSGLRTRLLFTSVNRKPAALIVEGLQLQRWIAKEDGPAGDKESATKFEVTRELDFQKITDIFLDPSPGTYSFHDALSGARGEILVE